MCAQFNVRTNKLHEQVLVECTFAHTACETCTVQNRLCGTWVNAHYMDALWMDAIGRQNKRQTQDITKLNRTESKRSVRMTFILKIDHINCFLSVVVPSSI